MHCECRRLKKIGKEKAGELTHPHEYRGGKRSGTNLQKNHSNQISPGDKKGRGRKKKGARLEGSGTGKRGKATTLPPKAGQ